MAISAQEVAQHNTRDNCWVIIHGNVYNLTNFLNEHPGGSQVILRQAGRDATAAFDPVHPRDIISQFLPKEYCLGPVDPTTVTKVEPTESEEETRVKNAHATKPRLDEMMNMLDFEAVARRVMTREGWCYFSSGADDEITLRENHAAFQRIWLKPRILVDVAKIDMRSHMLGYPMSFPVYITATALAKLGHPEGEVVLTRAAASQKIIQMIPTLASCSVDEITAARTEDQVFFFQLYVNQDRNITEKLIRRAEERGCKAIFITVDAPQLGRREKDMRVKYKNDASFEQTEDNMSIDRSQGAARAISSFISPSLCWDDLQWMRTITNLPLILKGVQTAEDAILAAQNGCNGIVLSNHGGRQLDFARSGIEILPEVMQALRAANLDRNMEVYVDGGIRRATDIFKALALGAKAVGIGRPFLYAMSSYGQEGVERAIRLLKDELEMVMRLMGAPTVDLISPAMVCARNLNLHPSVLPKDYMAASVYERMSPPKSRL